MLNLEYTCDICHEPFSVGYKISFESHSVGDGRSGGDYDLCSKCAMDNIIQPIKDIKAGKQNAEV